MWACDGHVKASLQVRTPTVREKRSYKIRFAGQPQAAQLDVVSVLSPRFTHGTPRAAKGVAIRPLRLPGLGYSGTRTC